MEKLARFLFVLFGLGLLAAGLYAATHPLPDLSRTVETARSLAPSQSGTPPPVLAAAPTPTSVIHRSNGSAVYLVPDSEVVYGPAYDGFALDELISAHPGPLARYSEKVEDTMLTGGQIIRLVAERYSIGPRVLLTLLELRDGWMTGGTGYAGAARCCLFEEASQFANTLNAGFYGKLDGSPVVLNFRDGQRMQVQAEFNPGTAALYYVLAAGNTLEDWKRLIGPDGFAATYLSWFGDPFARAIDPVAPDDLKQPSLRLPWRDGQTWFFTGGPHDGWGSGSVRAAVDFSPQGGGFDSCLPSADWAVAAADGRVAASEHGRVMVNLSGSIFQGDGWTLMYMHMGLGGRVPFGVPVKVGDAIGHPSCEGGIATGSHLHFARLYNGEWIAADDPRRPLVLSGWVVNSYSPQYDGTMIRGAEWRIASNSHVSGLNGILGMGWSSPAVASGQ